jgi:hypothetical protein
VLVAVVDPLNNYAFEVCLFLSFYFRLLLFHRDVLILYISLFISRSISIWTRTLEERLILASVLQSALNKWPPSLAGCVPMATKVFI